MAFWDGYKSSVARLTRAAVGAHGNVRDCYLKAYHFKWRCTHERKARCQVALTRRATRKYIMTFITKMCNAKMELHNSRVFWGEREKIAALLCVVAMQFSVVVALRSPLWILSTSSSNYAPSKIVQAVSFSTNHSSIIRCVCFFVGAQMIFLVNSRA